MHSIRKIIRVRLTVTMWRHMYKLVEMMDGEHRPGWWFFQARKSYWTGGEWGMLIIPPTFEPNHELNFHVPKLKHEEVVAACYMQLESKIVNGGRGEDIRGRELLA